MWLKVNRPNRIFAWGTGALLAALLLLLFSRSTDFIFLTNDDMYLRGIVAGEISGSKDAHMIYTHYILGVILSKLYGMWEQVPWYGMYLVGSVFLSVTAVFYKIIQRASSYVMAAVLASGSMVLCYSMLYRNVTRIQYTYVAALVGGAGLFWILMTPAKEYYKLNKREKIVEMSVAVGLIALCFMIRAQVFFMLIPFVLVLYGIRVSRKQAILFFGTITCVITFLAAADLIPYQGRGWKEFKEYNKAREQLMDYYGFPEYTKNKALYEELGLSKESYDLAYGRYMLLLDDDYNQETLSRLAAAAKTDWEEQATVFQRSVQGVKNFIQYNLNYTDRPVNLIVYMLYFLSIVGILFSGEHKKFFFIGALIATRMVLWMYLFYVGRYPDRVTQGLYVIEFLALLAFLLEFQYSKIRWKPLYCIMAGLVVICSRGCNITKIKAIQDTNRGLLNNATAYYQLEEYCKDKEENLYILDMDSISFYSDSVFKKKPSHATNLLQGGSWIQGSPLIERKLETYGIEKKEASILSEDNVYIIFRDAEETSQDYLIQYLQQKYGTQTLQLEDTVETDIGVVFHILKDKN